MAVMYVVLSWVVVVCKGQVAGLVVARRRRGPEGCCADVATWLSRHYDVGKYVAKQCWILFGRCCKPGAIVASSA